MSALRSLVLLALIVCSSQTQDCSYLSLLEHLNLTTTNNVLMVSRPVRNWTTSTLVQIDMILYGILEVDQKSQTMTSHVWFQMVWMNEFLTWEPSDFCSIRTLTIPISMLWIPDIVIQEDASDTGSLYKSPFAAVSHQGLVAVSARQRLTSTCQLKLRYFPFDKQSCNFTFGSMSSYANIISLGAFSNETTLTRISEEYMVTLGEWELQSMEVLSYNLTKSQTDRSVLVYMTTIIRKPMLYVINLIIPLFYLLVLDLASFFIHEARGEKLSFKITVLLSISVLLLILKDMLPSTEIEVPMMARYCVAIFAIVGISVLEAMVVIFLTDLDDYHGKKARRADAEKVEIQLKAESNNEPAGAEENGVATPKQSPLPLDGILKQILEEVKAVRQEAEERSDKSKPGYYRKVAEILDAVFFILYFLSVVIFVVYMYAAWFYVYFY